MVFWRRCFCSVLTLVSVTGFAQGADETTYSVVGTTTVEVEAPPAQLVQRVVVSDTQIRTLEPVFFRSGGEDVLPESLAVLDAVADVLLSHSNIRLLRIEAHTDSIAGNNRDLSQRRATWVRNYLINKGVGGERLVAKGFGDSRPIASNATREGRQINRRVEFVIVD